MKKLAFATALLGAGLIAQSAHAVPIMSSSSQFYFENNPATSSYVITLSGECSGKIELPVSQVYYGRSFDYAGSIIDAGSPYSQVYFYTPDPFVYSYGEHYSTVPGEKLTESVKNGKLSLNILAKTGGAYPYFYSLDDGGYDSQITCKNGQTLSQHLLGSDPYISYDAPSFKAQASVIHTHSTGSPGTGEYKAKFSSSGEIELPGECTVKGDLFSADYSVKCAPAKTIKIKVVASASGTSVLD